MKPDLDRPSFSMRDAACITNAALVAAAEAGAPLPLLDTLLDTVRELQELSEPGVPAKPPPPGEQAPPDGQKPS